MTHQIGSRVYCPRHDEHMTVIGVIEWEFGLIKAVRLEPDQWDHRPIVDLREVLPSLVPAPVVVQFPNPPHGPGSAA